MSIRFRPSNANSLVTFVCWTARSSLHDGDRVADLHAAVENPADRDPADVVARIEVGDEQLQRRVGIAARRRHVLDDRRRTADADRRRPASGSRVAVPMRALV